MPGNFGAINSATSLSAHQAVRRNSADSAFEAYSAIYPHANSYFSGTGASGTNNTAMDVLSIALPANTLTQVNDRVRIRVYYKCNGAAPITETLKVNGVTTAAVTAGATSLQVLECWLHYLTATTANVIEHSGGGVGAASAINSAGFNWTGSQNIVVSQSATAGQAITVYMLVADIFPKG